MENLNKIKNKVEEMKAKYSLEQEQEDNPNHSDGFGMYWSGFFTCLKEISFFLDSLQQELDSRSIPVLRADTTEKQDRILEIIGQDEIYCHFSLDFGKETDCGYEDYNDRVYIDGHLTFNKMAEIVDFLSKNSK